MAPPDKIGSIGTVKITYQRGRRGPTTVAGMSHYDFERLQNMVIAYAKHAEATEKLNDHPNRRVRNELLGMLGLPLQGPELNLEAREEEFSIYRVTGLRKKAVFQRKITLTPKYIATVEYVDTVAVAN